LNQQKDEAMAKGQMRPNKETRKPKKDTKKAAPAVPLLKAAPVPATKIKEKTK
jgi:hypothetical protein